MEPIVGTKIGTFLVIFGVIFWIPFWAPFGPLLGPILGTILGPDRPKKGARRAQEGHQELQRPKKLHFQKPEKTLVFEGFWGPEASQESLGRPKRAPKRHPKSFRTQQKRHPKKDPKISKFLTSFGAILGSILGPKIAPKGDQKWDQFLNPKPRCPQDGPRSGVRQLSPLSGTSK